MSNTAVQSIEKLTSVERMAIFPLRLSDFEYYMFVDDRPSHPMVFAMVAIVQGSLNRESLQISLDEAIHEHPLFDCLVQKLPSRGWCWVPLHSCSNNIEWTMAPTDGSFGAVPVRSFDLTQQSGLQVQAEFGLSSSRVVFHMHHACCDGIAALQFMGEVFARYGQKTAEAGQKIPHFESAGINALLGRERFDADDRKRQGRKRSVTRSIAKAARLILRRPVALRASSELVPVAKSSHEPEEVRHSAVRSHDLPRHVCRGLLALANRRKVSVNDLYIREMMLLARHWNSTVGAMHDKSWLRIAVPLSMRTPDHAGMPATNIVSYGFVTRRVHECNDPEKLLTSIRQQTGDILFMREGIVFLKCIRFLRALPGALKSLLGFKSCFCTVVLANVGEIRRRFDGRFPLQDGCWKAGNIVIKDIGGVAPVRPNTSAAVTIGDYGGKTTLHLRTDPAVFTTQQSQHFLSAYVARLTRLSEIEQTDDLR